MPVESTFRLRIIGALGLLLVVANAMGLYWLYGGYSTPFKAENILTYVLTADCDSAIEIEIHYEPTYLGIERGIYNISLPGSSCRKIEMRIIDGQGAFSKGDPLRDPEEVKSITAERKGQITGTRFPTVSKISDSGTSAVDQIGFANYRLHSRLFVEIPNLESRPKVSISFDSSFQVIKSSVNTQEQLSPRRNENHYVINPVRLKSANWEIEKLGNIVEQESWYYSFDVNDTELEARKTMFTIIFSTLIGVGISILMEAMLSMELLHRISTAFQRNKN